MAGIAGQGWLPLGVLILCLAAPVVVARAQPAQEPSPVEEATQALYRGDYGLAASLVTGYIDRHPAVASAWVLRARVEIARGQFNPAYDDLRKSLEFDPTNIDALYYLEQLAVILSQVQFRDLIDNFPESFRTHQILAESYLAQHHNADAEKQFLAALKENPASVEVLDALGQLKQSEYKFEEALDYYARAQKLDPHDFESAYGSGACELFQQNAERAVESLRRALRIDPTSAPAHLALGDGLLRRGQGAAAVTELQTAARLAPGFRQAYALLARAYQKLGRTREAEQALQKERELEKQNIQQRENTLGSSTGSSGSEPAQSDEPRPPNR